MPVNTPYGISSTILAPLSVGARVVMIPNNDPVKAWALMLGLGYGIDKAKYPRTSVDVVCASPAQYQMMLNRYDDLFSVRMQLQSSEPYFGKNFITRFFEFTLFDRYCIDFEALNLT